MTQFKTESDLCQSFITAIQANWEIYAETSGWDIIIRRGGTIIGVEAKLKPEMHALAQALPEKNCPHYCAVLVGDLQLHGRKSTIERNRDFLKLAKALKIIVLTPSSNTYRPSWIHADNQMIGKYVHVRHLDWRYYRRFPKDLPWLPPSPINLPAGVPSPRTASKWATVACLLEMVAPTGPLSAELVRKVLTKLGVIYSTTGILQRWATNCGRNNWQWYGKRPHDLYPETWDSLNRNHEIQRWIASQLPTQVPLLIDPSQL
jgi:hypothetical protein